MIWRIAVFLLLIGTSSGLTATWHVAKDGSGDFEVIQDAVDAASAGDTIHVHAGRYDEVMEDYDAYGMGQLIDLHVAITKDRLTLRGDGADVTIIGPEVYPSDPGDNYTGVVAVDDFASSFVMEDLAIENVEYGIYVNSPTSTISRCRFEGSTIRDGVYVCTTVSCDIVDCEFVGCNQAGAALYPSRNVRVVGCSVDECAQGFDMVGTANFEIVDTTLDCVMICLRIQQGSYGSVSNCPMTLSGEYGTGMSFSLNGSAVVTDCTIAGGNRGILVRDDSAVTCERVSLTDQSLVSVWIASRGASSFDDCQIINGGGDSVRCALNAEPDCVLDMTNCDWGTDSQAQIEEWIVDGQDGQHDPEWCCTVEFIPFQDQTATESQSWSEVKGLFEGRE